MATYPVTTVDGEKLPSSRHRQKSAAMTPPPEEQHPVARDLTADEAYPKLAEGREKDSLVVGGPIIGTFRTMKTPSNGMKRASFPTPPQPHGTMTLTPPDDADAGSLDVLEQMLARGRQMINAAQPTEGIQVRVNRFGSLVKSITLSW